MTDIKTLSAKIAKMKKLDEKQAKAQMSVIKHEIAKNASRQKAIEAMRECRLVQSSLQKVQRNLSEDHVPDGNHNNSNSASLSPKAFVGKSRGLFHVKPKKFAPMASSAIMPNTDLRDNIIERITNERDE